MERKFQDVGPRQELGFIELYKVMCEKGGEAHYLNNPLDETARADCVLLSVLLFITASFSA